MQLFSSLYHKMLMWARHPHAPVYLYSLSFAESSFFPIPPDVMLAPMALAHPHQAIRYAFYTTLSSVLGGVFGYFLGAFFIHALMPYIIQIGYSHTFHQIESWFGRWGFWIMFVAGFAPIPYKLFTIAAGALHIPLIPFILGSAIGRGGRFFLVALLIRWKGASMEKLLLKYIDRMGWILVIIFLFALILYHYYSHGIISPA